MLKLVLPNIINSSQSIYKWPNITR